LKEAVFMIAVKSTQQIPIKRPNQLKKARNTAPIGTIKLQEPPIY